MTLAEMVGEITIPPLCAPPAAGYQTLDAAGEYVAFVIAIPKTGTLKKIAFKTTTVTTADTINIRIETVDDTTGYPTGTLYDANGTGSQESPASLTMYWVPINGSTGITVTKGDIVAIKFLLDYVDGNLRIVSVISNVSLSYTTFPYLVVYVDATTTKSLTGSIPIALEYDGEIVSFANAFLNLATSGTAYSSSGTPNHRGMKITIPAGLRAVGAWIHADIDNPADLILYDADGVTALQTIAMPDKDIRYGTSANVYMLYFTTPQTLIKDSTYRLILKPTSTSNVNQTQLTFTDDGDLKAIDQMPLGQAACYTYCTDTPDNIADWTDDVTQRPLMGLIIDAIDVGGAAAGGHVSVACI